MKTVIKQSIGWIISFSILSVLFGCIVSSKEISQGISQGLLVCWNALIPSLFFFMTLSNIICNTQLGLILAKPFSILSRFVFRLDPSLFPIFLLGLIGGYPVAPKIIGEKIRCGQITPSTGSYLLNICVNCSPAFLISYVSLRQWNNLKIGVILFCAQLLSCLVLGIITSIGKPIHTIAPSKPSTTDQPLSIIVIDSIVSASKSLCVICSFVLVSYAIFPLIQLIPLPPSINFLASGMLDVVSGVQSLDQLSIWRSILFASFFTSFGGFCVYLQVFSMLHRTGIKFLNFLIIRLCYTILCLIFTWLFLIAFPSTVQCINMMQSTKIELYSHSMPVFVGMLILSTMILLFSIRHTTINLSQS